MTLHEDETYYDILDIPTNASPDDIRKAYYRIKAAYEKESVVLYTLLGPNEREDILKKIEAAYLILSEPDKRRQYDQHHGLLKVEEPAVSRDFPSDDEIEEHLKDPTKGERGKEDRSKEYRQKESPAYPSYTKSTEVTPPPFTQASGVVKPASTKTDSDPNSLMADAISQEIDWKGSFIKKVRESRHLSLEELSSATKISKTYLNAIEEEDFSRLPAAVYVRGFIVQIAKTLRLPVDKVVAAYTARCVEGRMSQKG